jgi:uncharacterized protein involved in outer membrane biogenesis
MLAKTAGALRPPSSPTGRFIADSPGFLVLAFVVGPLVILAVIAIAGPAPMTDSSLLQTVAHNRWARRIFWTVLSVLLLWALAWLVVPPLLKSELTKAASAQLGRKLQIGDIDFKPWTLELTVRDLVVAGQNGSSTQLAVRRLYVNAEMESLLRLAPVVNTLTVDGPQLTLRRLPSGGYDIDDIIARLAARTQDPNAESNSPLRFALFNLSITDGAFEFDDQPAARQHQLRDLSLTLPFLSNLQARREITVTPQLAFTLNGSRFDSSAATTPFAQSRKTDAQLRIHSMDLAPYLPYVPRGLPVQLQKAVLDADLQLKFVEDGGAQVVLSGKLDLNGVALADAAGSDLLAFDGLKLVFNEIRPLEQRVSLASVSLLAPRLQARRDAKGQINLAQLGGAGSARAQPSAAAPQPTASGPVASASAPLSKAAKASESGWQVSIAELSVRDGSAHWNDASLSPAADLAVSGLTLDVRDVVWPMARPLSFSGAMALTRPVMASASAVAKPKSGVSPPAQARLAFEGSATDQDATAKLALGDASLALVAPYVAQFVVPELQGTVQADMTLRWKAPDLQLAIASLNVDRLALIKQGAGADLASVRKLAVTGAEVDLGRRAVSVAKLEVTQPEAAIARDADARWMFAQWLRTSPEGAGGPATAAPTKTARASATAGPESAPWQGKIDLLQVRAGAFRFDDRAASSPVAFDISALELELKSLQLDGKQAMPTHLAARVAARKGEPGSLDYRGTLRAFPLQARGKVQAQQIPLHVFEPYFGGTLNIDIARADAGFKGDVDVADNGQGPVATVRGDVVLEDFRANSIAARDGASQLPQELLNWKALGLRGLDLAMAPGKPLRVAVRETSLSDFFARVIVHENGRINLQDIVRSGDAAQPLDGAAPQAGAAGAAVPAKTAAPRTSTTMAQGDRDSVVVAAPAAPAPVALAKVDPLAPIIQVGPISLVHGKVFFSDRFVKPNYSANLTELTGKLSAFSSQPAPGTSGMADLELRGRAEGTASLEILGKLNPLAQPLALDIKGKVRDLELPPLSPYAVKYAGYGIERGKLSVDVAYLIQPDGQLTASNQVVLNQLAFGDKVEGAPNSLPVKLAVALLADRNGVIDINLPVSGSLNDPQFRLGPVIFRVIVNLIGKALTAPFSLLASAFGGGGDELSQVAFASGSALLMPQAAAGLDKVAKALTDRPMLKMTVVGTANLERERDAYQRRRLQELLQAEKRRAGVSASAASAGGASAPATTASAPPARAASAPSAQGDPDGSAELLRQVYLRSEITKPRDLDGKAKVLPPAEMEALLLANIPVDDEAMRELALQRGVAVKDYLVGLKLPVERLFLGAAKTGEADAKWSPRAELKLGTD